MTTDQLLAFGIIAIGLALFAWGRWRYDVVALGLLLFSVIVGIVPADRAFTGFGNAAVVTVIAVLILGRALQRAGVIDRIADVLRNRSRHPVKQILAISAGVAFLSAFMNNVGALALMLPVTMEAAKKHEIPPSKLLMPTAFASLLGGLMTLIGTPPNIIIASYRAAELGVPFGMFDFTPVGGLIAIIGIAFLAVFAFRLLPDVRKGESAAEKLFEMEDYVTETRVPTGSHLIGKPMREIFAVSDGNVSVVALYRGEQCHLAPPWYERIEEGDTLIIEGDPVSLKKTVEAARLEPVANRRITSESLRSEDVVLTEVVVSPGSRLEGHTARGLRMNARFGANVLAVAREARPLREPVGNIRYRAGDMLLLQGPAATMPETLSALGCLPLAERELMPSGSSPLNTTPVLLFLGAIAVTTLGLLPAHIAFMTAVVATVLLNALPLREAYEAIDWPVVVLLGAMLPVGAALQTTGATELVAGFITELGGRLSGPLLLVVIMAVTMLLSAVINNAATAVLMAPVAIGVAKTLGVSIDPFLMAVAVGCSCAFLTPIGHQSNILVMVPGGYRFGDYWRLGLPLSILILATAPALILWVWPLSP